MSEGQRMTAGPKAAGGAVGAGAGDSDAVFSRRALGWLLGLGGASLLVALGLAIFGRELAVVPSIAPDSFSRSAVGHSAAQRLLEELDIPVLVSRHATARRATADTVVLVLEPRVVDDDARAALAAIVHRAPQALVALPKWQPQASDTEPTWIGGASPVDDATGADVLAALGAGGGVVRTGTRFRGALTDGGAEVDVPALQVIDGADGLEPLVEAGGGILLGRLALDDGRRVLVLSDPDLLSNHGLDEADNAAAFVALVEELRPPGGAVVIDETLHGHELVPSLWRELFTFPLSLLTGSALACLGVLLLAAGRRFGAPAPLAPALAPGKLFLVDNTAELLRAGGHTTHALERYLHAAVGDVARHVRVPSHVAPQEQADWLDRLAAQRGAQLRLAPLQAEVARAVAHARGADALATANRIHRWRQEMIDGPRTDSRR